jgi:hypothetical protein
MAFADHLASDVKAQWTLYRNISLIVGVTFYFFAGLQSLVGYNLVERIKAETSHGTEKYTPKPYYKIALWALIFLACGVIGFVARSFL